MPQTTAIDLIRDALAHYREMAAKHGLPATPELPGQAEVALACSEFIRRGIDRFPELFLGLLESGDLAREYPDGYLRERLARACEGVSDPGELGKRLRLARWREFIRLAWRDLAGLASLAQVVTELSDFADAAVDTTNTLLFTRLCEDLGTPRDGQGRAMPMTVLALGKLGAHELNFSSDIDLIFAYPAGGETSGGKRRVANEKFYTRLARQLIDVLDATTDLGRVFRVDMRLRPFGTGGPLVISHTGLETYYQNHGRDWERYAMIRARVITGYGPASDSLLRSLRPFVYRRYLDFSSLESMREMKKLILREVERQDLDDDVKRGAGGIREVEFVVQAFQLVRGGRLAELRDTRLMPILERLGSMSLMPVFAVAELSGAYEFLRRAENRLQEYNDAQQHTLPKEPVARARLALAMGLADWKTFEDRLRKHRRNVRTHFDQVFGVQDVEDSEDDQTLKAIWSGEREGAQTEAVLCDMGFEDPGRILARFESMRGSYSARVLSRRGRDRLDLLVPTLLRAVRNRKAPDELLHRLLTIIEAIGGRSVYLALLNERPLALSQLLRLCEASIWITDQIAAHPVLLDELLDPRVLMAPLSRTDLDDEISHHLDSVAAGDEEQELDVLRQFKHSQSLRVAAADISGALTIAKVSDHLTAIAESALGAATRLAWRDLALRFGQPSAQDKSGQAFHPRLLIVAYGKFGGFELGYGSDLDLVFLHNSHGSAQHTDGERQVDNSVFFARLAQRVIHILTTRTAQGALYEVDARLRPSGNSGLLVTSLDSFADYQRQKAWIWEHQAIVRARPVFGSPGDYRGFEDVRREILAIQREPGALRVAVRDMRQRMRDELGNRDPALFDIKQGPGGIADIEFMVQYMVLRWPDKLAENLQYPDNLRLLDGIAATGLLTPEDSSLLQKAYLTYRDRAHALFLAKETLTLSAREHVDLRSGVTAIWRHLMETP